MKYTLFVDESGDFETQRGEWVVAGPLCACGLKAFEKRVGNVLNPIPSQFGLEGRRQMHLSDLRGTQGHKKAVEIAGTVFKALDRAEVPVKLVAAVNRHKRSAGSRERTYRLMLLDLLSLSEALIPEGEEVDHFDLVIATRRQQGASSLMTSSEEIREDVLNQIEAAVEVGLASRGLIESFDRRRVALHHRRANQLWGLAVADFFANVVYNARHKNVGQLIDEISRLFGTHVFESFGGYEVRRARIAERDGHYVAALQRWAQLEMKEDKIEQERREALRRLMRDVLDDRDAVGPRASLEALIERLRRAYCAPGEAAPLFNALQRVEKALENVIDGSRRRVLLFRLRSFMLQTANHRADFNEASALIEKQDDASDELALNPSHFPLVLDYKLARIQASENRLDFQAGVRQARTYRSLVQKYGETWDLLMDGEGGDAFRTSRISLRAQMTLARCLLLASCLSEGTECWEAQGLLDDLKEIEMSPGDEARLRNYRTWSALRTQDYSAALATARASEVESRFDLYFAVRAATKAFLFAPEQYEKTAREGLNRVRSADLEGKAGHPYDLIWRERGVLEWKVEGNKRKARQAFRQSEKALEQMHSAAPIIRWLRVVLNAHEAALAGETFSISRSEGPLQPLAMKAEETGAGENMLSAIRHVSPF